MFNANNEQVLLQITDLNIFAGEKQLVHNLSCTLAAGDTLGVIGESGSGKSLTAYAISGILPQALSVTGSIKLAGLEVTTANDAMLRQLRGPVVATVFQEPQTALDPLMRVGKQIALAIRRKAPLKGQALSNKVAASLAEVGLSEERIARAYPHELSGGQRQRVALAIALAQYPQLLIADEPTTALDVTVQQEILQLLKQLATARNMALLFISHDLAVVNQMATRLLVMQQGSVVEQGSTAQVLQQPAHPYTQQLLSNALRLENAFTEAGGGAA